MVRADKVTRGVSFPEAMRRRYGAARGVTQEGGGQLHEEGMYVGTVTDRLVAVELCGKDKLAEGQSLGRLGVASLRGQSVSRAVRAVEAASPLPSPKPYIAKGLRQLTMAPIGATAMRTFACKQETPLAGHLLWTTSLELSFTSVYRPLAEASLCQFLLSAPRLHRLPPPIGRAS